MTGFLAFLLFSQSHSFTIKDATLMSQSFTSMDARTKQKDKDVPVPYYPEPDGDPSY